MGYRKLSARPRHHAQAEGAIEDFKKTSPRAWRRTASTYIFGAVCPKEGKGAALIMPACNTEAMNLHLTEIAAAERVAAMREMLGRPLEQRLIVLKGGPFADSRRDLPAAMLQSTRAAVRRAPRRQGQSLRPSTADAWSSIPTSPKPPTGGAHCGLCRRSEVRRHRMSVLLGRALRSSHRRSPGKLVHIAGPVGTSVRPADG